MTASVRIQEYGKYDRKDREEGDLIQVGLPGDHLLCKVDDIESVANTDALEP
jgi:hypothetical protein